MAKREYLILLLILLGCTGLAWGVTAVSKEHPAGREPANPHVTGISTPRYLAYSQHDNGTTARIHTRDIITVRLPENPSTGYRWDITTDPGLLTLDDTYIYTEPSGMTTGKGGVRFLTLQPKTTGTVQISAICRRTWEADTENIQVFTMTFIIT